MKDRDDEIDKTRKSSRYISLSIRLVGVLEGQAGALEGQYGR